jgi:hypothetical protein
MTWKDRSRSKAIEPGGFLLTQQMVEAYNVLKRPNLSAYAEDHGLYPWGSILSETGKLSMRRVPTLQHNEADAWLGATPGNFCRLAVRSVFEMGTLEENGLKIGRKGEGEWLGFDRNYPLVLVGCC